MEKEFVTIEQAKELFELGYDLPAVKRYFHMTGKFGHDFDAPLKQQVFRWFRDKYGAHMHPTLVMPNVYMVQYGLWTSKAFDTYEEAESACIDKLIELAKQQDK